MTAQLAVRVLPKQRRLIDRGAELADVNVSEFVRSAALEAAREEVVEAEIAEDGDGS